MTLPYGVCRMSNLDCAELPVRFLAQKNGIILVMPSAKLRSSERGIRVTHSSLKDSIFPEALPEARPLRLRIPKQWPHAEEAIKNILPFSIILFEVALDVGANTSVGSLHILSAQHLMRLLSQPAKT